jgi:hypothetical protein
MAKTRYNPLQAIQDDPLAGLKKATVDQPVEQSALKEDTDGMQANTASLGNRVETSVAASASMPAPTSRLSSAPVKPLSANLKPSRNTVYLYPEDLTKLRQLSGYASTEHGVRANDSMIVRAALSLMETDVRFLHALKEAELSDRRRTSRPS